MSTTVDERIVSMQFDNKNFEANVQTSMSTLQKLKQALRLDGAAQGLTAVQSAASKVTIAPLGTAVEAVKVKFDALGVVAATTLANITNKAVNAAEQMAKSLTITPITTGFSEYELKMNSMQTIMSSTGEDIDTVNKYLNELNEYSDKTIYSFSDMTQNIGKFTNAGVKLEDAVAAIQGISNEAALSGANANEASRAMYNFAQALSAGHVKLIDWKSIENANMATVGFKEELIKTAIEIGTLTEAGEGMYQTLEGNTLSATSNFNETLQDQWMTSEVLIKTLKKYSDETTDVGQAAFEAATKVRTFSQLMDTLKESAQSGWATTWELIFGNLEEAKSLWTSVSDVVGGFIQKMNDARNEVLRIALGMNPFSGLADKISKVTGATEAMTKATGDYEDIVNRVIRGEFGHTQERWDKLTEMGYDWAHVQNLVNEKLGSSVRHTSKLTDAQKDANKTQAESIEQLLKKTDAQLKELGFTQAEINALRDLQKQSQKTGIPIEELIKDMDKLNGRSLLLNGFKNIGQGLANVFKSISKAWKEIFPPKSTEEKAQSLYNLLAAFHKLTTHIPKLYDESGKLTKTGDKLVRTFKGLFALVDIFTTLTGGVLKIVLKTICKLFGMVDVDILSVTARIGDAIVKVRDWIDEHNILAKAIQKMLPYIKMAAKWFADWFDKLKESGVFTKIASAIKKVASAFKDWLVSLKESGVFSKVLSYVKELAIAFKDWIVSLKDSKVFKTVVSYVKKMSSAFKDWIDGMKEADNIPKYIIEGLVNGLKAGITAVVQAIKNLITKLIETARDLLGIHSPSREFTSIGEYIIEGLINGIKNGISLVAGVVKHLVNEIVGAFDSVNWGAILGAGLVAGLSALVVKIITIVDRVTSPLSGLNEIFESTSYVLKKSTKAIKKAIGSFANVMNAMAFSISVGALKSLAIAIAILVGSIIALTFFETKELWQAVGIIAVLAAILIGLALAVSAMSKASATISKDGVQVANMTSGLLGIGAAILMVAWAIKIMGDLTDSDVERGLWAMVGVISALAACVFIFGLVGMSADAKAISATGKLATKIAFSLLLMIGVIKLINMLEDDELIRGAACMAAFAIFVRIIGGISASGNGKAITATSLLLLSVAVSMAIMIKVIEMLRELKKTDIIPAIGFAAAMLIFIGLLVDITSGNTKAVEGLAPILLSVAVVMAVMVGCVKILGEMEAADMWKGIACIAIFSICIAGLIAVTKYGKTTKLMQTMLGIAACLAVMALVTVMLGYLNPKKLAVGLAFVLGLTVFVGALIAVTKLAKKCEKTILMIGIVIGILAGTLLMLSFIKPEKLIMPTLAMMGLMGMFALIIQSTKYVKNAWKTLLAVGITVAALAGIIVGLSFIDPKKAVPNTIALGILMASMMLTLKILNSMKVGKTIVKKIGLLALLAATTIPFAYAMKTMASMSWSSMLTSAVALSAVMFAMTGVLAIVSNVPVNKSALGTVLMLAALVIPMWVFAKALSAMDGLQNAIPNAIGLSLLMAVMVGVLAIISKLNSLGGNAISAVFMLAVLGVPLALFAFALAKMDSLQNALSNAIALSLVMAVMVGVLVIISSMEPLLKKALSAVTSLILLSVAIAIMSVSLMTIVPVIAALGSMDFWTLAQGLIGLAGALTIIGLAGQLIGPLAPQLILLSVALGLFGLALNLLVPPLQTLGSMGLGTICVALLALAGALAVIGVAAALLSPLLPAIMGLAAAIAIFGVGALAAGVGIAILAAGLTTLATSASTIVPGLTALVTGLLPLIPVVIAAIGNAILLLMQQIVTIAPVIATTIATVLLTILTTIATYLPSIIEAGVSIIMAILTGIRDNIGQIVTVVIEIVVNFINAVSAKLGAIIAAGINLMLSFIEGVASGLRNNKERISAAVRDVFQTVIEVAIGIILGAVSGIFSAGVELIGGLIKGIGNCAGKAGKAVADLAKKMVNKIKDKVKDFKEAAGDLVDGLVNGIKNGVTKACNAVKDLGEKAKDKFCDIFDINSPSRVMFQYGKYIDEGLVNGLKAYTGRVVNATDKVGTSALNSMRSSLSMISAAVNSDMDAQPTIRPVLDLSDIRSGAGMIGGLFANPTVGVAANIRSISSSMSRRQNGGNADVISAINDLKSALGNVSGNTYSINGITYDDGSNVADAVQSLIRATKVERRV